MGQNVCVSLTDPSPDPLQEPAVIDEHYQIGEVADSVGLSLRTIRYYEEIGLVAPSGRTEGGFRLYTDSDVERLRLVKALKPVGLSLDTMGDLLEVADQVASSSGTAKSKAEARLEAVLAIATDRCDQLEERLAEARHALREIAGQPAQRGR
jgi:MerR family transcriptional regulator, copper efflux regulator